MATPIIMPRQGQSVESCILTAWTVAEGQTVTTGQVLANIETDKATFEVEAPAEGVVLSLFFKEGDDIPVLTAIGAIGAPGESFSHLQPGSATPVVEELPHKPSTAISSGPVAPSTQHSATESGISPRARRLAEAKGIDPACMNGTGPGGRIIERDVQAAAAHQAPLSPAAREALASGTLTAPAHGSGPGGRILAGDLAPRNASAPMITAAESREIPVAGIRKIIAQRMRESLSGTAQLTLTRSFDAGAIQSFRRKVKAHGEAFGLPPVTINDLIVFTTVRTLMRHPALNAHFLGDRIIHYGRVNLGIAVDTPRGLMVPVLAGAETLNLHGVAASVRQLADSCQKGNISPDHLTGGTFTITNLGALGIETFTPVLNTPEVAILGVGGLTVKPVRTEQGIAYIDAIHLSLTIDHQAVDGAPAARFLKDLCESLENIELLLAAGA
ncbi:MAG TPA: dihydrolipoamide acetyltransferase family protein [Kiritimatiellia bacterium]|nr:dihydrolipoamide acetyltransferase family protein [Kiritimatiellia bacterium]